jgi:prolyl oligopeptidase
MEPPPYSEIEPVTELLHGVPVSDPYRWLEDQESPRTRAWISAQTQYARCYLDSIPGRERIRERVRALLDVQAYDSPQKIGSRYFFRKRSVGQEQFCICMREGLDGRDEVLIDPARRSTGPHTAVKPLCISPDGRLLLYEVKQGGERTGRFELLDISKREVLPDRLPRGYLRGFAFAPGSNAFYYVHEAIDVKTPVYRAAYNHVLGASFTDDEKVFSVGNSSDTRLHLVPGPNELGFLVIRYKEKTLFDFYLSAFGGPPSPQPIVLNLQDRFEPALLSDNRILALTNHASRNSHIVEIQRSRKASQAILIDIVPATEWPIQSWMLSGDHILISYLRHLRTEIDIFDFAGKKVGEVPVNPEDSVRLIGSSANGREVLLELESFAKPRRICSYSPSASRFTAWSSRKLPSNLQNICQTQVWFPTKDGLRIPMYLVGREEVLERGRHPVVMTSYGGCGIAMTPQFSVLVALLVQSGCLFALPSIRGGSEFGSDWHRAAKGAQRQVAFNDFIAAAEWLVGTARTRPDQLAIFGGSNSGLLVGAAMIQRPDLFGAVLCMAPLLDMVRYHLFDSARLWRDEYGSPEDSSQFPALLGYSPYHNIREETAYPAVMIVSGDADQNCNPMHARKMIARLQAASVSSSPILLDYSPYRGHSPVLPLSERIEAVTDRITFLSDQLRLTV